MGRQKTLFGMKPHDDSKSKHEKAKPKNTQDRTPAQTSKLPVETRRGKKARIDRTRPKSEFYTCECGLMMHWKVAEGRRDGCPACGKPIPLSELFLKID
ncbi:MAG: hypothetical protein ACTSRB_15480 [Candidatus Helarchaeota archaeon]